MNDDRLADGKWSPQTRIRFLRAQLRDLDREEEIINTKRDQLKREIELAEKEDSS